MREKQWRITANIRLRCYAPLPKFGKAKLSYVRRTLSEIAISKRKNEYDRKKH